MLILVLSLGLTAMLLAKVGYRHVSDAPALGMMSQRWVDAYNASQAALSQ